MIRRWLRNLVKGTPAAGAPPAPPATYSESELLARTEEFNRNAEAYWVDLASDPASRRRALNKPFATIGDASSGLYRLGLVLSELRLGVGHTVLDFGAGSCWLSSALNRLGCHTVSVDVSPTALSLGQELFALDPRHRSDVSARFLPYDGHRLPLDGDAVDRVVCFDAFHHVPNQDELLSELFRVLRPGGRAVLAEPGEGHSHADHSLFESERHGVLENDLDIADLEARARRAGFDRVLLKPYPDPGAITLDAADYIRLRDGDASRFPMDVLQAQLRVFYVITLTKGTEVYDSRNPHELRAEIRPKAPTLQGRGSTRHAVDVELHNVGDTVWLHREAPTGGFVVLAGHLLDDAGRSVARDFVERTLLPRDVEPGGSVSVTVPLVLPGEVGRYTLRLDLVSEGVVWFSQAGSPTADVALHVESLPDDVDATALRALLQPAGAAPPPVLPGVGARVSVRATNTGTSTWPAAAEPRPGAVSLGGHVADAAGTIVLKDALRAPLPHDVTPGETVTLEGRCTAPTEPGAYTVRVDLVMDGVCWFEQRGGSALALPLLVEPGVPDSRDPGVLRATLERRDGHGAIEATAGQDLELALHVVNTGNTRWLASTPEGRGCVALGGHLLQDDGAVLDWDALRVALPADVAPGSSVELRARITAPARPGACRLQLDMVDEGITWFAARGSVPLDIPLRVKTPR